MDINFNSVTGIPSNAYDWTNKVSSNPAVLAFLIAVIVVYYILFASLGSAGESAIGEASPGGGGLGALEVLMWGLFVVLVLTNGLQYFFNINLTASIKKLFSDEPQIDLKVIRKAGGGQSTRPKPKSKPTPPPAPGAAPQKVAASFQRQ